MQKNWIPKTRTFATFKPYPPLFVCKFARKGRVRILLTLLFHVQKKLLNFEKLAKSYEMRNFAIFVKKTPDLGPGTREWTDQPTDRLTD